LKRPGIIVVGRHLMAVPRGFRWVRRTLTARARGSHDRCGKSQERTNQAEQLLPEIAFMYQVLHGLSIADIQI
jgi:hypothetical protein